MAATICPKCDFKFSAPNGESKTTFCPSCKVGFALGSPLPEPSKPNKEKAKPQKASAADDGIPIRSRPSTPFAGWGENWTGPAHGSQIYTSMGVVVIIMSAVALIWGCAFAFSIARRAGVNHQSLRLAGKAPANASDPSDLRMTMASLGIGAGYLVILAVAAMGVVSWAYFGNSSRGARVAVVAGLVGLAIATCGMCFLSV